MNTSAAISKIFWPSHLCSRYLRTGFIIGWNVRSFTACIATVVSDIDLNPLVSALGSLTADPQITALNKACGVNPVVLGVVIVPFADGVDAKTVADSNTRLLTSRSLLEHKQTANLWLTIEIKPTYIPSLESLHCCGFRYTNLSSEIIFYKQPDPRSYQFLSLDPLILDISKINASGALFDAALSPKAAQGRTKSAKNHSRPFMSSMGRTVTDDMNVTLQQINSSYEMEQAVHAKAKNLLRRRARSRSMSEAVRESAVDLTIKVRSKLTVAVTTLWPMIQPFTIRPLMVILLILRALVEVSLWVLNLRFPSWVFNGIAVKDMTTTGQQIDLRLQQACFWPWQYFMAKKKAWTNTSITRAQYISFYNSMWLVANDIIIGVALGSFLISNNKYMGEVLQRYVKDYTIDSISAVLEWLTSENEYPAGLKLNPELNPFLGQLFKWLIEIWADFIISLQPMVPVVINMIGLSGAFGATMSLSLISDLLAFTTIHIYWFYMVAARIFHWQLTILYSLFNLFRGKKRNTLRHRIDSCDYDLDQLLLGTILFTLLTFLFPTIVVYYLTFALSRVMVICMQATMETVLACLNHFPLFAIMLRLKDPDRLPGGLRLEVCPERFFFDRATPLRWVVSSFRSVSVDSPHQHQNQNQQQHQRRQPLAQHHQYQHQQQHQQQYNSLGRNNMGMSGSSQHRQRHSNLYFEQPPSFSHHIQSLRQQHLEPYNGFSESTSTEMPMEQEKIPRSVSYLLLSNSPLPASAIFFQYSVLWKRLSSHYFTLHVLKCLLSGETIRSIPRLQYPMLPDTRSRFTLYGIKPTLARFWAFCEEILMDQGALKNM
ncbi:N-acetylglucosaminyl transferase component-domain-containing protein [Lobosporangium transversale]|uniref:N-acetylglucosaminyl transferase component-domain-containing protein n=1 Tax=Lobosporangium transversale TaxID=64571 RepID=A0A1Y2GCU5_9FUNG|nr:N-acetylglucosaminyl transferase component-domain-containing protein [Lobosporangium transversale]ORZ07245.1 N-acetylglucosaminyl transferase component-domain-containing protein [Lobosporangium transversale]|eukprot:XP_021877908.1 N-acetylglucosaminyl transferase component-domain-containing protein [Lobosporangium transversale]